MWRLTLIIQLLLLLPVVVSPTLEIAQLSKWYVYCPIISFVIILNISYSFDVAFPFPNLVVFCPRTLHALFILTTWEHISQFASRR